MDTSKIKADLHVHTVASIHAFSSIRDITRAAAWRGLKYVAITDHFYENSAYGISAKQEISRLKVLNGNLVCKAPNPMARPKDKILVDKYPYECGIISGVELNFGHVYDYPGVISTLGIRLGGFHNWFYDYQNKILSSMPSDWSTLDKLKRTVELCPMDIIVHPERDLDKLFGDDMDQKKEFLEFIVSFAKENGKILEMNEASLRRNNPVTTELMHFWVRLAKQNDVKISLGSDAHVDSLVGGFGNVVEIIDKVKYPEELIVNTNLEWLENLAKPYTKDI